MGLLRSYGRAHMSEEIVCIQAPDGRQASGSAVFVHYSTGGRVTRAILYVFGGLVAGTACIIVPIVHLFSTWGFPLLGVVMAMRTMRRHFVIDRLDAVCPT